MKSVQSPLRIRTCRWRGWSLVLALAAANLVYAAEAIAAVPAASSSPSLASPTSYLSSASSIASPEAGWPQFRGPRRDGTSDERGLLPAWPETGPKLLWTAAGAGKGFSSPIIGDGRIYLTGDFGEDLFLVAYDLAGKPLWRVKNGAAWLNQYQGARASVTYRDGRLYHQNAHGRLACFEAASGKELWAVNVLERFRGENITWGLSECLLVDERAVYVNAGGRDALLVALDRRNGEVLWQSEPLQEMRSGTDAQATSAGAQAQAKDGKAKRAKTSDDAAAVDSAGYAAPILVEFAGRRSIVGASSRHLFCADADTGKIQWTRPRPTSYSVLAMSPVLVGDAVFMTAPHGPPGMLHRLIAPADPGGRIGVEDGWTAPLDTAHGGVVYVPADGRLYGAYYPRRGGWAALDAATGKVLYEEPEFVKGAALYADKRLYALCEDGWMLLLEPTATAFEVRGRFRLATARDRDAWAHPVILEGRMYLRYHDSLRCYDIRAGG